MDSKTCILHDFKAEIREFLQKRYIVRSKMIIALYLAVNWHYAVLCRCKYRYIFSSSLEFTISCGSCSIKNSICARCSPVKEGKSERKLQFIFTRSSSRISSAFISNGYPFVRHRNGIICCLSIRPVCAELGDTVKFPVKIPSLSKDGIAVFTVQIRTVQRCCPNIRSAPPVSSGKFRTRKRLAAAVRFPPVCRRIARYTRG